MFGDRRGPNGAGPMTGRGAGFCAGYDRPGYANAGGYGRGFGRGQGRGFNRGFGRGYAGGGYGFRGYAAYPPASFSKEDEKNFLKREVELIEQELEAAKKRLNDINSSND